MSYSAQVLIHTIYRDPKAALGSYGLTAQEYLRILTEQDFRCAICEVLLIQDGKVLKDPVVDHNHEAQYIRGILCRSCNAALGRFADDPDLWRKASEYLKRPPLKEIIKVPQMSKEPKKLKEPKGFVEVPRGKLEARQRWAEEEARIEAEHQKEKQRQVEWEASWRETMRGVGIV